MNDAFGPWSTAIGSNAVPLSWFWRRRMQMLGTLGRSRAQLARREFLALSVGGMAAAIAPTLCYDPEVPAAPGRGSVTASREATNPGGDRKSPGALRDEKEVPSADTGRQVKLSLRKDNGPYGTAAYSFRFATQDFKEHRNAVDLVYNRCGLLHANAHGGMQSRIVAVGKNEFERVKEPPKRGWYRDCIKPVKEHVYIQEINDGRTQALVKFVITDVDEETLDVKLKWAALTQDGKLPRFYKPDGAHGTLGQCGGPHRQS